MQSQRGYQTVIKSRSENDLHQDKLVGDDEMRRTLVPAFLHFAPVWRTGPSLVDQEDIDDRGWTVCYPSSCRLLCDEGRCYNHNDLRLGIGYEGISVRDICNQIEFFE